MQFGGVVLRMQLKSPKAAIIRAGTDIVNAEGSSGVQAGPTPSLALREEVCRKLADAIRTGQDFIELNVQNNLIVESPSIAPAVNETSTSGSSNSTLSAPATRTHASVAKKRAKKATDRRKKGKSVTTKKKTGRGK